MTKACLFCKPRGGVHRGIPHKTYWTTRDTDRKAKKHTTIEISPTGHCRSFLNRSAANGT